MDFKKIAQPLLDAVKMFSYIPEIHANVNIGNNVFGFYSPSGGTGVTTLVANLAVTIASTGKAVAVIDGNLMHPQLFRYLTKDKTPPLQSMTDRWINTASPLMEYAGFSEDLDISVFSTALKENVADLTQFNTDIITKFYHEVATHFDFVLIDMHGHLNDFTVFAALPVCTKILTLVRAIDSDIEDTYRDEMTAIQYHFGTRFTNLIQSPVHDVAFKADDLKEQTNLDYTVIANIPYCSYVAKVGANYDIFVKSSIGTDAASQQYREAVKHIAESILNYGGV